MLERLFIARCFLIGGAALALVGLVLWRALSLATAFPPYLATGVLALGYGAFCLRRSRPRTGGKP
jgi:hypothetical protein